MKVLEDVSVEDMGGVVMEYSGAVGCVEEGARSGNGDEIVGPIKDDGVGAVGKEFAAVAVAVGAGGITMELLVAEEDEAATATAEG